MNEIPDDLQAELAALADGTLAPARREQLLELLERSPALAAALDRQRRALEATSVAQSVAAPAGLHDAVERLAARAAAQNRANPGREEPDAAQSSSDTGDAGRSAAATLRRARPRRRLFRSGRPLASAAAVAIAAAAIAIALLTTSGPTIAGAVALTQRDAARPARVEPANAYRLAAAADGIHFPKWTRRFGWRATGERIARIDGRAATAVYYRSSGRRLGYAIVTGAPIAASGGRTVVRGGVRYRLLEVEGVPAITWLRKGHTCVIAGRGVSSATLLALANWPA